MIPCLRHSTHLARVFRCVLSIIYIVPISLVILKCFDTSPPPFFVFFNFKLLDFVLEISRRSCLDLNVMGREKVEG
uniref:Uncharacterized protein n=1 Tax=Daphnia magna TaxID=35525 RepID=A0A0N8DGP1_9CRUS